MAVVKADAYGHGAVPVSLAALRGGADALGVTTIAEALQLRAAGIDPSARGETLEVEQFRAIAHAAVEQVEGEVGTDGPTGGPAPEDDATGAEG